MIGQRNYPGDLTDRDALVKPLVEAGLSPTAAEPKADLFARAATALPESRRPAAFFVPGRIEVLGKHTDYAGGESIIVAVERGFCLVVSPRNDSRITVGDVTCGETVEFDLDPDLVPRVGHWSNYPMTVARRIARNFPGASVGADVVFASDLPPAAGMSSSSVMIVAMFLAVAEVNHLWTRPEFSENVKNLIDLAGYLATIENGQTFGSLEGDRGVGTFGGSEDHTAILCCRPGLVSEYSYCPVRFQRAVAVPGGYTFAVGASGVVAEKTGSAMEKYNRASRLAWTAADLWRRATGRDDPHLAAVLASSPEAPGELARIIETAETDDETMTRDALLARFEHFLTENEQLRPAAGDAFTRGDMETFGQYVDRSQRLAEDLLGNQIPETSYLAASARENGAVASTAFGAGFGGSVWAMVETSQVDSFLAAWAQSYRGRFPEHAETSLFFATGAGPAAFQLC